MSVVTAISGIFSGIFGAISAAFNYATGRQNLNNTPAMQQAQTAQKENKEDDEISKTTHDGNVDACRNDLS